eukprot:CAMPEP_0114599588 /NCGR_PEP_ID=MMETSP0125-20121206/22104_1 /TAXON_ID=485358 ORGANISM="Aristerostoma sp., Strain ATCC 50986" /NCGR_SAMPLE_ID=MMETSP0125 /ASSEMBLY_ACC=CAM_ASM_000245 /LENGTH=111 /DNA_ID=CAMNT_0001806761 /DNA_START=440 /DNA_END=775 /DNA_ORIENTATION=-
MIDWEAAEENENEEFKILNVIKKTHWFGETGIRDQELYTYDYTAITRDGCELISFGMEDYLWMYTMGYSKEAHFMIQYMPGLKSYLEKHKLRGLDKYSKVKAWGLNTCPIL